jgi:hypothetical protein
MSTKSGSDLFQERVDELLLMEKRIEKKIQQLTQYNDKVQQEIYDSSEKIDSSTKHFDIIASHKLERLEKFQEIAHNSTKELAEYNKGVVAIITGLVIAAVLFIGGATWRLQYLLRQVDLAKAELEGLNVKLSQTPEVIRYGSRDYIRIIPFLVVDFNKSKNSAEKTKYGSYAAVWYPRD